MFQNIYLASVREFKLGISREITSGKIFSWPRKVIRPRAGCVALGLESAAQNKRLSDRFRLMLSYQQEAPTLEETKITHFILGIAVAKFHMLIYFLKLV